MPRLADMDIPALEERKALYAGQMRELGARERLKPVEKARMARLRKWLVEVDARIGELGKVAVIPEVPVEPSGMPGTVQRVAKIYCVPRNKRMRLIEFDDGEMGKMWCRPTERLRAGWRVKVEGMVGGDWMFVKEWP